MLIGLMDSASVSQVILKSAYNVFVTESQQMELVKDALKSLTLNGMNISVDVFKDIHKSMVNVCLKEV